MSNGLFTLDHKNEQANEIKKKNTENSITKTRKLIGFSIENCVGCNFVFVAVQWLIY